MDDRNYAHIGIYRDHGLVGFQGSSATEGDFVDAIYATSSSCMMLWWLSKALSGFGMFLRPQSTGPSEVPRLKFNLRFAFGPGDNAFLSESRRRCALHRGEIYTMRMQQDVGPRLLCGFKRLMIDSTLRRRIRYRSRDETRRQSKPRGIIIGNVTPHMAQCALTIDREAAFRRLDGQTWFNSMH